MRTLSIKNNRETYFKNSPRPQNSPPLKMTTVQTYAILLIWVSRFLFDESWKTECSQNESTKIAKGHNRHNRTWRQTRTQPFLLFGRWLMGRLKRVRVVSREGRKKNQKRLAFGDVTTGFPAKWRLRNERRHSILMTRHYPDLGSTSDWLNSNFPRGAINQKHYPDQG